MQSMNMPSMKTQSGFTLVEIAVVLVIIGLLLGGILKGQELIENSRIKSAANDINAIRAAYTGYIDRYRQLPGDDPGAVPSRGPSWTGMTAGNGDGRIDTGTVNALDQMTEPEQIGFFRHLRAAGFLSGNPATTGTAALPRNPWGGLINIVNANNQERPSARLQVCLGNVPGKAALALDTALDDGRSRSGTLRATAGADNAPPTLSSYYDEGQTYTICVDM